MMRFAASHASRIAKTLVICLIAAILLAAGAFIWTLRVQEIHKWEKQTETFSIVLAENTSQQMDFGYTALSNIADRIEDTGVSVLTICQSSSVPTIFISF